MTDIHPDFTDRVVRGEPVAPAKITVNAAGRTLVDFGKHFFGWIEVDATVAGPFKFIWGELLDENGSVQTDPFFTKEQGRVRCALAEGRFAGAGWERVPYQENAVSAFEPSPVGRFGTVMPFRWLEIVEAPFPITGKNVRQEPIYYPYDMDEERFDCDSPDLVRVHDFCKHTILATTFTGKFVDGDRERLPYEADSYITQLGTYAISSDDTLVRAMADSSPRTRRGPRSGSSSSSPSSTTTGCAPARPTSCGSTTRRCARARAGAICGATTGFWSRAVRRFGPRRTARCRKTSRIGRCATATASSCAT